MSSVPLVPLMILITLGSLVPLIPPLTRLRERIPSQLILVLPTRRPRGLPRPALLLISLWCSILSFLLMLHIPSNSVCPLYLQRHRER